MLKQTLIYLLLITLFILTPDVIASTTAQQNDSTESSSVTQIERREHIRFNNNEIKTPVLLITDNDDKKYNLINISRSGLSLENDNNIKIGDTIPVHIKYKDIDIKTPVEIVSSDNKRAGGRFVSQDKDIINNLLYLSIILEFDNGLLVTSFKEG